LSQAQNSRLLADPNVTVMENEPAVISIVTEIPYQQLTQTQQGGNIGTTAFREAGVKLEVTPQIADDGTIQMYVTPSFSRLTGYTPGDQPQPIIDKREARTTVRVANGQTLVIGGLRQRQEITDANGIPYLKDIKYIGALFRSKNTTYHESELLVFVRPEIVTPFFCGTPREQAAAGISECLLNGVPTADSPRIPFPTAPVMIDEPPGCPPPAEAPQYGPPVQPAPQYGPPLQPEPEPQYGPPIQEPLPPAAVPPLTPAQRLPPLTAERQAPLLIEPPAPGPAPQTVKADEATPPAARIYEATTRPSSRRRSETPKVVSRPIGNASDAPESPPEPNLRSVQPAAPRAPSSRAGRF
jgi:general secretion pathway protein D